VEQPTYTRLQPQLLTPNSIHLTGPVPERHERPRIRQPVPGSTQDPRGLHPEVHLPDQRGPEQVDRLVSHFQHDLHLPHPLLPHDQDQRGCAAMDPRPHRKEENAEERA